MSFIIVRPTEELKNKWRALSIPTFMKDTPNNNMSRYVLNEETGRYLVKIDFVSTGIIRADGEEEYRYLFFDGKNFHTINATIFYFSKFFATGDLYQRDKIAVPSEFAEEVKAAMRVLAHPIKPFISNYVQMRGEDYIELLEKNLEDLKACTELGNIENEFIISLKYNDPAFPDMVGKYKWVWLSDTEKSFIARIDERDYRSKTEDFLFHFNNLNLWLEFDLDRNYSTDTIRYTLVKCGIPEGAINSEDLTFCLKNALYTMCFTLWIDYDFSAFEWFNVEKDPQIQ